jgi:hypothetical protein
VTTSSKVGVLDPNRPPAAGKGRSGRGRRRPRLAHWSWSRPAAVARGRREGPVDVVVDPACRGDAQHLLGAALEQGDVIELLEGVAVGLIAAQVLHDRDHRDRCLKDPGEPGDEQRPRGARAPGEARATVALTGMALPELGIRSAWARAGYQDRSARQATRRAAAPIAITLGCMRDRLRRPVRLRLNGWVT